MRYFKTERSSSEYLVISLKVSVFIGTANSAAALGVGARTSAAKSGSSSL